jgi:hypothetical protein
MRSEKTTTPSTSTPSSDRRAEHRAGVDLFVNRFLNGYPYLCRAVDISRTGMRIVPLLGPTEAPRFMGLQFQLPGSDEVITASGETVFTSDGKGPVGVRFTRLPPGSAEIIERFVAGNC